MIMIMQGESSSTGKWSAEQQRSYMSFLEQNQREMDSKALRKSAKVFLNMSRHVRTRTPDQCRSHHQKVLKSHNCLSSLIANYRFLLYGKKCSLSKTQDEQQLSSSYPKIYRIHNRFRIEILEESIAVYYL